MTTESADRQIDELLAYSKRGGELALAWVESLRARGIAGKHRAVAFRCKHGCSVLEVYPSPAGTIVYQPRYRLSPTRNAEASNESGRAANTEDGDRRWRANAGYLPEGWEGWTMSIQCDHLEGSVTADEIVAAVKTGKSTVIR